MKMKIWFDMDGTIADLYGVRGWLPMVEASDTTPYEMAKPLVNMARLARYLNRLQKMGHEIGIISWTSKGGTDIYNGQVALAKMVWLYKHLPSVTWDNISPRATYQIAYRPYGYRSYNYTNTNKTNITLTNLTSGVCYQVQVRACINGVYGG